MSTYTYVCIQCGGPREIEYIRDAVTKYKPCAACGAIGVKRVGPEQEKSVGTVKPEK